MAIAFLCRRDCKTLVIKTLSVTVAICRQSYTGDPAEPMVDPVNHMFTMECSSHLTISRDQRGSEFWALKLLIVF